METEKHYLKVGLFCLAALVAFVFYLIIFSAEHTSTKRYVVYFDGSVNGLIRGANVKLRGIPVGLVDDIRFSSTESDRIVVTVDIDKNAPVRSNTLAAVATQGITGAAYMALDNIGPSEKASPLAPPEGEKYPVIPSRQSGMDAALDNLGDAAQQLEKLLSDKNISNTSAALAKSNEMFAEATAAFREIKMFARELRQDPSIILKGPKYKGYKVPD